MYYPSTVVPPVGRQNLQKTRLWILYGLKPRILDFQPQPTFTSTLCYDVQGITEGKV